MFGITARGIWENRDRIAIVALLLLTCIHFELNESASNYTSSAVFPGLGIGFIVLLITGIVLCYKIFNAVEVFCRTKGWLMKPLERRYDILLPFGIPAAMLKFENRWHTEGVDSIYGAVDQEWVFRWGDKAFDSAFIFALCAVVLLLRILELIRSLDLSARARPVRDE